MQNSLFEQDIDECLSVLKRGGIILYPTDTIWGLGCDATNAEAVDRIFALKQRAEGKSMIVLLDSEARLESYVRVVPPQAYELIEYTERPLTIVYDGAKNLAENVIAT